MSQGQECVEEGLLCPVVDSVYGYRPSLAANSFFLAFFALCFFFNLGFGITKKTWTFMIAMLLGCGAEVGGYAGRLLMWKNVYDNNGFIIQICLLIIAPAFFSAAIYITLKHFVITFGVDWSRLRPTWYTRIFITCDLISLILQGAGGGLAATADNGSSLQDTGTNLMIAGVSFQVVALFGFGVLTTEYAFRTYRRRNQLSHEATTYLHDLKFRLFAGAVFIAYLAVLTRCTYRIPELSSGWSSPLMRNQTDFIALEGAMIVLAVAALTFFHPGFFFPVLANTIGNKKEARKSSSSSLPLDEVHGDYHTAV